MTKEERERTIREKVLGNVPADMTKEEAIARIQEHMIAHKMKEPRAILLSVALDMAVNALKQEPREHGEWIHAKVGKLFPSNDFKCSKCGNILDFNGVNCGRGDANYCPNCGADMRKEQK